MSEKIKKCHYWHEEHEEYIKKDFLDENKVKPHTIKK